MSNFFLNSQLYTSLDAKELRISNYIFKYHYYNSALDGKISWDSWLKLSPKLIELFTENQKSIREAQNAIINKG